MAKAKKGELFQEDLMIYAVSMHPGVRYYIIERAPYEKEGLKKGVFRYGSSQDAVFDNDLEAAEAALAQYPSRGEGAAEGQPAGDETKVGVESVDA